MGEVQLEILRRLLRERFGLEAEFDAGSIVDKETIAAPVEGVGHFEPCATMPRSISCWSRGPGERPVL